MSLPQEYICFTKVSYLPFPCFLDPVNILLLIKWIVEQCDILWKVQMVQLSLDYIMIIGRRVKLSPEKFVNVYYMSSHLIVNAYDSPVEVKIKSICQISDPILCT